MYFLLACLTYHAKRFIERYAKYGKGEREEDTFEYQKRFTALNNNCHIVEEGLQDSFNISTLDYRKLFIIMKNFFRLYVRIKLYLSVSSPLSSLLLRVKQQKFAQSCQSL